MIINSPLVHSVHAHRATAAISKLTETAKSSESDTAASANSNAPGSLNGAGKSDSNNPLGEHADNNSGHRYGQSKPYFGPVNSQIVGAMHQLLADAAAYQERVPTQAQQAETKFRQQFTALAQNEAKFHLLLQSVYGSTIDIDKAEDLRQSALQGDYSWMPKITFIDTATLNGAAGAYAAESHTIFINEELLTPHALLTTARLSAVLTEEIGHSIDAIINVEDATGDEGAMFHAQLNGAALSTESLAAIRAEDDSGVIDINGTDVSVEYSKLSKELGRFGNRLSGISSLAGLAVQNALQAAGEQLNNVKDAVVGLIDDAGEIITTVIKRPFEVAAEIFAGVGEVARLALDGKILQAATAIRDTIFNSGKLALSVIPEVVAMSVNTVIMAVDRLRGAIAERGLSADEKSYLNPIFGTGLSVDKITIVSGGLKDQMGMEANVVGTEIFMPNKLHDGTQTFNPDGSLTPGGMALLGHEAAHVWQYEQHGTSYIGESLVHQIYDGEQDTYNWHHAVVKGTPFSDMNPERQAEIAGLIGQAIAQELADGGEAELTLSSLNKVINSVSQTISEEQFHLFQQAHALINPEISMTQPERVRPER